jgi:hypothetical protein
MGHRPNRHRGESHHKRLAKRAAKRAELAEQERENEKCEATDTQAEARAIIAEMAKMKAERDEVEAALYRRGMAGK